MMDLFAVQNPLTLKLAIFVGAFLLAASSSLVRPYIAQPLLTSIQNSPGVMHATAAVTAFAGGGLLGWIAGEIIVSDEVVHTLLPYDMHTQELVARPLLAAAVVIVGLVLARRTKAKHHEPVDLAPEDKK